VRYDSRPMPLELESPAFPRGAALPPRFTAAGDNCSPPLAWTGAPKGTRSFALIVDDPDVPSRAFVHWLAWNIAGHLAALPECLPPDSAAVRQGKNDFGALGWGGPKPPRGKGAHRYVFRLLALDRFLDLAQGASRRELEAELAGCVLDRASLMAKAWCSR
jgi:Raf kinase inhibitor-like YbhB/YbcL family protein